MSREYKFRGIGIGTGGSADGSWRYGLLVTDSDKMGIQWKDKNEFSYWQPVDPETIGQYTGLKDKNGREIFEGDVVRFAQYGFGKTFLLTSPVEFDGGMFEVITRDVTDSPQRCALCHINNSWDVEVIGNIYEYPELLEPAHTGGKDDGLSHATPE